MSGHEHEIRVTRPFHVKPGFKTTEFYVALLVVGVANAIVLIEAFRGAIDANGALALASAALTSFGYSRGRSLVKTGH